MNFFVIILNNFKSGKFEKWVKASSKEYIEKHPGEFFNTDFCEIVSIDSEIYKNCRTAKQVTKAQHKRFGYKVVRGMRVYN